MANVLIIGLDGATWRVLEPWARAGRLPHLAGLMARGSWGTLRSTVPALTLPAWSSLTTGRNPGAHGVFAFRRLTSGRTAAALHLMRTRPTDVLGVVFYAPDRIQHCFWTYVDGGVAPDTEVATAVAGVYAALDQGLGDLTAAAGPEATVILVSDHGFGPKPSHAVHVNRWLADAGFLRQRPLWTLRRKVIRKVLPRSWRSRLDVIDHILVDRPRSRAWADTLEPRSEERRVGK